ncbi:hypothetical protein AMS68_000246 [Peltaster fructicola]|uniref:DUF7702 domain-containing protein n=1 Tax=Peltaster fructicola TaxID=286661 RepID=A0A6H0XJB5_9PEZI|nr:hypothetical protein AMS68_000246 [Peltaster fructicola]
MSSTAKAFFNVTPQQSDLQWFELIFFALTLPILGSNYLVHRKVPGGTLGWWFLFNFSVMRVVGVAMVKAASTQGVLIAGLIISSSSISTLFFSFAGIWHEASYQYKENNHFLYGWGLQGAIHLSVGGAIGMAIAGVVTSIYANGPEPSYSRPLEIVGSVLFIMIWLTLCGLLAMLWMKPKSKLSSRLQMALLLVSPLLGLRVVYSLCGAAINDTYWSYTAGPIAAQVCMQVLPECLIIIIYSIFGYLASKDIARDGPVRNGIRESSHGQMDDYSKATRV